MKYGITMLIVSLLAIMVGLFYRTNGSTFWGRMMRRIRFNRFFFMLMGRRPVRRLLRG